MRGLIDALDPYCSFLSKEQYEALQKRKESGNAGLGIILSKRSDVIYVVSIERDSPAAGAGIRPGDYLLAVNDKDVENLSILEVDKLSARRCRRQSQAHALPKFENDEAFGSRTGTEGSDRKPD